MTDNPTVEQKPYRIWVEEILGVGFEVRTEGSSFGPGRAGFALTSEKANDRACEVFQLHLLTRQLIHERYGRQFLPCPVIELWEGGDADGA